MVELQTIVLQIHLAGGIQSHIKKTTQVVRLCGSYSLKRRKERVGDVSKHAKISTFNILNVYH